jgi:hypothetical protein
LIEQEWAVRHSASPSIVLETVVLELCRLKSLTSLGDLLSSAESGTVSSMVKNIPALAPRPVGRSLDGAPSFSEEAATPKPEPSKALSEGEPVLAVDEIEDPQENEKNPEMAKLKSQWREILEKVGSQKKALQGILMDTRPKKLEEGTLVLVCKGPFHHEQLSKPENKVLVERLLEEAVGRKINLVPVLPEGAPAASPEKSSGPRAPKALASPKVDVKELEKEEPLVAAALKMFGGKIVEVKRNNPKP